MSQTLTLSTLPKTWIFDVDGTLVIHNGHLRPEGDELLPRVKQFFDAIPVNDAIILMTARKPEQAAALERFLAKHGIRYDHIIYGLPMGERILFNDNKPSGLVMGHVVNRPRDSALDTHVVIDERL